MGDLWERRPGITYAADFTVHGKIKRRILPERVNTWRIMEVTRTISRNVTPHQMTTETRYHVGSKSQTTGFLRHASFDSLADARQWAATTGDFSKPVGQILREAEQRRQGEGQGRKQRDR